MRLCSYFLKSYQDTRSHMIAHICWISIISIYFFICNGSWCQRDEIGTTPMSIYMYLGDDLVLNRHLLTDGFFCFNWYRQSHNSADIISDAIRLTACHQWCWNHTILASHTSKSHTWLATDNLFFFVSEDSIIYDMVPVFTATPHQAPTKICGSQLMALFMVVTTPWH